MYDVIAKLVSTAWELARIQLEGVEDFVGFSNADKHVGAHLAAMVEADPEDSEAVRRLAALVGVKYQRQTTGLVGVEALEQFKALAKGTQLTPEDRRAARSTVVAQPDTHPQFGTRVLFSFQFSQGFAQALKSNGGKAFMGPDGWKWAVRPENLADAVAALEEAGARIVGSLDVPIPAPKQKLKPASRAVALPDEKPIAVPESALAILDDYQREGVLWLLSGLNEARRAEIGGHTIRGKILADKPGLGKTPQSAIAMKALVESLDREGRIVILCPASFKIGWAREIAKFCGADETVNVCYGDVPPDPDVRWNVVNFDILQEHYDALVKMGFDVLIIDEAHNIKNEDAIRSKLCLGGEYKLTKKEKHYVEGLCKLAHEFVLPMTGTPLANRAIDLFNLLKAIGHPLGRSRKQFGLRYGAPTITQVGKRVHHSYKGTSNLAELRKRIAPVFMQRFEVPGLKPIVRSWTPVEVDVEEYRRIMADYYNRRKSGELKASATDLALLAEARKATAMATVKFTMERAESVLEADEKVLIFSYYTEAIDKFKEHFGEAAVIVDGRVPAGPKRQAAIDKFQEDESVRVFIGQLIAAREALTLTAGSYVISNDMDWVPMTHIQAEKRAHRRGQLKQVFTEYMVAAGTFSETLALMLEEKLDEVNEFEGTDVSLFNNLVERLNADAPRNEEIRKLTAQRKKRAA
jgi:hypothetical protein